MTARTLTVPTVGVATMSADEATRAALALPHNFARGEAPDTATISEIGTAIIGRDIDAREWQLPGWRSPVPLHCGAGVAAFATVLFEMNHPQRVRIGARWVKDARGEVATDCVPARLPVADVGRWLRAAFFAELREAAACASGGERVPVDVATEFTLDGADALRPDTAWGAAVRQDTLDCFLITLPPGLLEVAQLHLHDFTADAISARIGKSVRTVSRSLRQIRERALAFDAQFTNSPAAAEDGRWRGITMPLAVSDDEVRGLIRSMTSDEVADRDAGYTASVYRRRRLARVSRMAELCEAARRRVPMKEAA